ncbi:hypothetical protein IGI04_015001, partial [Brassica rapa subsp. trilocularis]
NSTPYLIFSSIIDFSSLFSRFIFSRTYRRDPPSPSKSTVSVEIRRLRRDPPSLSHATGDESGLQRIATQSLQMLIHVQDSQLEYKHLVTPTHPDLDDMDFYIVVQLVNKDIKRRKANGNEDLWLSFCSI